ncbi:MAG: MFS transporter, partial [Halocynthiibacter sp.]
MVGVSTLAMNIFLPSLQGMAEYFNVEYHVMQLSVALYLGMNAIMQLIVGPISDRFGRRPVVLTAIILFMLMTLGCIFSPTATVFLMFRMAQAVIVTAMVLSRAIIRDMVPASEAASMMGYVTMGMAVIPMIA